MIPGWLMTKVLPRMFGQGLLGSSNNIWVIEMLDREKGILDVCFLTWVSITEMEKEKAESKDVKH
jgi:hypothetical protein